MLIIGIVLSWNTPKSRAVYLSALLQVLQCTSVLQYGNKDEQINACYIVPIFHDGAKHLYATSNCSG